MDPDTDVCHIEQPQIRYSVDFIAEQSSAIGSHILTFNIQLGREGIFYIAIIGQRIEIIGSQDANQGT